MIRVYYLFVCLQDPKKMLILSFVSLSFVILQYKNKFALETRGQKEKEEEGKKEPKAKSTEYTSKRSTNQIFSDTLELATFKYSLCSH